MRYIVSGSMLALATMRACAVLTSTGRLCHSNKLSCNQNELLHPHVMLSIFLITFVYPLVAARMSSESRAMQLLYHINFVMPLVNVLTWVRPLSRVYLAEKIMPSTGAPLWVLLSRARSQS